MSIFKGNPSTFVTKQIEVRQNKILERNSNDTLMWLNSNTATIRLTSSVNIVDDELAKYLGVKTGNNLAKNMILQNGELYYDESTGKYRQRYSLGKGGSYGDSKNGSHSVEGNVPMAGIESVSIQSLSENGTLSTASITIRCNSMKQLEKMWLLYGSLGYSILLEVTNSIWFDNNGKYQTDYRNYNILEDNGLSKEQIFRDLNGTSDNPLTKGNKEKLIEKSSGNYLGMFLIVKNFSISNVPDSQGSFILTIDGVSVNEIQDSLRINYIGSPNLDQFQKLSYDEKQNLAKDFSKSKLNGLLSLIANTAQNNIEIEYSGKNGFKYYNLDIETFDPLSVLCGYASMNTNKNEAFQCYIKLSDFVSILNKKILLHTDRKTPYITLSLQDDRGEDITAFAHYLQIPTRLDICYIESIKNSELLRYRLKLTDEASGAIDNEYFVDQKSNRGYLKNIYLNINHLINCLNVTVKDNSVNLYDYVTTIMKGVSDSIGGINDFRLVGDMENSVVRIIDAKYTEGKGDRKKDLTIELSGLKSIVRDYSMHSSIFPAMMNTIAISAGGGGRSGATGVNTTSFDILHQGIRDRVLRQLTNPEEDSKSNPVDKLIQKVKDNAPILEKSLAEYVTKLNDNDAFTAINTGKVSQSLMEFINLEIALQENINKNSLHSSVGILPLTLNLKIGGIAGFRIGDIFKVPSTSLPVQYSGYNKTTQTKIGFAVTRINHTIQDSEWLTELITQTVILDSGNKYTPVQKCAIYEYSPLLLLYNKKYTVQDYIDILK